MYRLFAFFLISLAHTGNYCKGSVYSTAKPLCFTNEICYVGHKNMMVPMDKKTDYLGTSVSFVALKNTRLFEDIIKPLPSTQIKITTYTKTLFLGQAIKDNVLADYDVVTTVSGVANIDFEWMLGDIKGIKKAHNGVFKLTKGDLQYTNAVSGDNLIMIIEGQKKKIATYKPGEIRTWQDLQAVRKNLGGTYKLMRNITFPDIDENNIGDYNFTPIGNNLTGTNSTRFTGVFMGNGYTISKLYSSHGESNYIGLFGYIGHNGKIKNIKLTYVVVSGNDYVGSLTGCSDGIIEKGHITGKVIGIGGFVGGFVGYNNGFVNGRLRGQVVGLEVVGGLVGSNDGLVFGHVVATVRGQRNTGGLVGVNSGSVSGYAKSDVLGGKSTGGLVGDNIGLVNGHTTGYVFGSQGVGGLVGLNNGYIRGYTTCSVKGNDVGVGGLVGYNTNTGCIVGYATGKVTGSATDIGGLVGFNGGCVIGYATGTLQGGSNIGGLVGYNTGTVIGYANGSVEGVGNVGGLAGTTFGVVVGYHALGSVSGGAYVGGLVGSNFNSLSTVGYWEMTNTIQPKVLGSDYIIGISSIKNVIMREGYFVDKNKKKVKRLFAHPLFIAYFDPPAQNNKWPKLKRKIVIDNKSHTFPYLQSP